MAAIASHASAAMFAATEIDCFRLCSFILRWHEWSPLVVAVAKGLCRTFATGAVPVAFTRFNIYSAGRFLSDMGCIFGHVLFL